MSQNKNIFSACLAAIILLSSTAVLAEDSNTMLQPPSSQKTGNNLSAEEIKLRAGPGNPVAGKSKSDLCFGCHGENGNSFESQIPKLAGQYGIYIAKQVRNYQTSARTHLIMSGMAETVNDNDLADIAAYFASQPMMKGDHPPDNKLGGKLFENDDLSRMVVRCSNCHGATGKGLNSDNPVYPVIGGQHKEYLLEQLRNFKKGVRNNSPGGVMNITVHRLSDAEMEALADYISGL